MLPPFSPFTSRRPGVKRPRGFRDILITIFTDPMRVNLRTRFLGSFERAAAAGVYRWTGDTRVITHALLRPLALSRRCHLVASVIATSCRLISTDRATGHCQLVNIWYARRATTARLSHFYFCSPRQLITNQLITDHLAFPGIVAQLLRPLSSVHYE